MGSTKHRKLSYAQPKCKRPKRECTKKTKGNDFKLIKGGVEIFQLEVPGDDNNTDVLELGPSGINMYMTTFKSPVKEKELVHVRIQTVDSEGSTEAAAMLGFMGRAIRGSGGLTGL